MTELTITPKTADKTARFRGAVAAGEHVAVTIKGGAAWLGDDNGEHLSLRVLDLVTGRTLAVFPRPPETYEDGDEPEEQDEWKTAGEDDTDLFCNLNLNTDRMVNAARHMLRVPVLFVLGAKDEDNPATTRTLYFRDRYIVEFWPERVGDDTPYDLDKWPKQIDEWTQLVADWNARLDRMKLAAQRSTDEPPPADVPYTTITLNSGADDETDTVVKVYDGENGRDGQDGETTHAWVEERFLALAGGTMVGDIVFPVSSGQQSITAGSGGVIVTDGVQGYEFTRSGNAVGPETVARLSDVATRYEKPQGGIPASDLAGGIPKTALAAAVQSSLGKADTALQEHQSLSAYVNAAVYDSNAKKILLKHDSATVAEIDATAFIKDGMVDGVEVSGGNLVISFNTDAGIEDIEIPLTDIFNPANYYDKTAADGRFVQKETGKGLFSGSYNDLTDKPTIPPAVTVDDTVTRTSANPVKSSGIWGAIWGTLTALPTGFSALYDWVVSQLAGKVSKRGDTITGPLFLRGASLQIEDTDTAADMGGMYAVGSPSGGGTVIKLIRWSGGASQSVVLTAENAATIDYVQTLLAGKVSGALGSGGWVVTNGQREYVFASDSLADDDLTIARIADLRYAKHVLATPAGSATLLDRADNLYVGDSSFTSCTFTLPEARDGKIRDFLLDVDNSANTSALGIEFYLLGEDYALAVTDGDDLAEITELAAGERARFYFTETAQTYTPTGAQDPIPVISVQRMTIEVVTSQGGA